MNIVILTSAHERYDTRIFIKQAQSISRVHKTFLLVADGSKEEFINPNLKISSCKKPGSRLERFFITPFRLFFMTLGKNAKVVHIHDPELLIITPFLKLIGLKVIFDAHEDYRSSILDRPYIIMPFRKLLTYLYSVVEFFSLFFIDVVLAATSKISEIYNHKKETHLIKNYALEEDIFQEREKVIQFTNLLFIGCISKVRGVEEMSRVLSLVKYPIKLNLVGEFERGKNLESKILNGPNSKDIIFHGKKSRQEIKEISKSCFAGVILFHPTNAHVESNPNKVYEYMALGLPIIYSDFKLWKEIMEENKTGIPVDPLNCDNIADAINNLIENPNDTHAKGLYGQHLFKSRYNWNTQEEKLLKIYSDINAL